MEYTCEETIYEQTCRWTGIVLSASNSNVMNEDSLDWHRMFDPSEYAPILGRFTVIDESDIGRHELSGGEVEYEDIGETAFVVERGHHRATISLERGVLLNICENK